jgi:hypothetical protein
MSRRKFVDRARHVHSGSDGRRLFTFTGETAGEVRHQPSVAGDVDGDGFADLIVGRVAGSRGPSAAAEPISTPAGRTPDQDAVPYPATRWLRRGHPGDDHVADPLDPSPGRRERLPFRPRVRHLELAKWVGAAPLNS